MYRLIPGFIQEQYAKNILTGSFEACTLFVDVSGFTAITDGLMGHGQHGAEILANIIQEVFDPLMERVFEQGGFVTNLAGDAFTAVFPRDDQLASFSERGLAAAWRMQQIMAASAEHQTPYGAFSMSVKVGLAAGEVTWGIISSEDGKRATYYFQGEAIDRCAEAQKSAQPGELLVDSTISRSLGSKISAVPVGDYFQVVGIHSPLPESLPYDLGTYKPEILSCFFPPEVIQGDLSGEFRQVVNMFVSLPTVRRVDQLELFIKIIFELQDKYGGLLNRLDFGDKGANIPLFWGAPVAHENDVNRALNFVLDLQAQTVIPVNAGITYGIAHGGYSGGVLAGEYTCHGRGTTLAARFMQASTRGEIWVDEHVAARGSRHFEIEFEGEMSFKGFTQKQKVFLLLERKEESESFYQGPMVGRQGEKARLVDFVEPIFSGRYAGVMVIKGEPGIGKSRLVHGFLNDLKNVAQESFSVFICQTDEIFRESLNPFRYWLRRYFSQSEQQSDVRNKRSFNRKLDRLIAMTDDRYLAEELDRTRSFLAALVNLYWPDSLYEQLEAQGRYENSLSGLLTLMMAESQQQPLILLLEDSHWLDGDSKLFLGQLTQHLVQEPMYPLVILATARTEGQQAILGEEVAFDEIILEQLPVSDQESLAAGQLGSPIGSDLLTLLVDRAEGNPFFSEQILRYLQEQELLYLEGGIWRLQENHDAALPTDVRAVLVARLDRLTQEVKEVVQTASVLGREFEIQLLVHMLQDESMVREMVTQAEAMSIWSALSELRYLFKHGMLRDAAYHMQIRSRRQILHQMAVAALETHHAVDLASHYGEVAYHAEQARLIDKARRYLELAGDNATDAYQNNMAVAYYSRALALTPDTELESRFRLLMAREGLYSHLGARQEQLQDLGLLKKLAEELEDNARQAKVLLRKAWQLWWTGDYSEALQSAQRARRLAEAVESYDLAVQADYLGMWVKMQQGTYSEARPFAENALTGARQSGNRRLEARVLSGLGLISRGDGDYFSAYQLAQEALTINREMEDRSSIATSLSNLGVGLMTLGDYAAARDCFKQGLDITRQTGSKVGIGTKLINLCWCAETQGEWEAALGYGNDGIAIAQGIKHIEMAAEGNLWLGYTWLGLGKPEQALAAFQSSLELRRELGQEYLAMGVLAGMSQAALAQSDLDLALNYVEEILSYLNGGGSLGATWEPYRIYLSCYRVLQLAHDARASEILKIAYQELRERADKIPDRETRRRYLENVPWHAEIVSTYRETPLS